MYSLLGDKHPGPLPRHSPQPFLTDYYNKQELVDLVGKFYIILVAVIIRKYSLNRNNVQLLTSKLCFLSVCRKGGKSTRLCRIFNGLYLWYLIMNFMFLTIVNPSMKNPGPQNQSKLSVFYCNIQGLIPCGELSNENPTFNQTKLHELNCYLIEKKPDIVIYNETWLKSSIHDNELLPSDVYKVFRLDRCSFTHPP